MAGSLGNIYESIQAMDTNYMDPNLKKENVLNPKVSSSSVADTPFLFAEKTNDEQRTSKVSYRCEHHHSVGNKSKKCKYGSPGQRGRNHPYASNDPETRCPICRREMKRILTDVHSPAKEEVTIGYVKGLMTTYIVMDNLQVKPMSTISLITLLKTFKITDLDALEKLEVFIGKEEAVAILEASLITDRVLTSLFLGPQKA